MRLLIYDRDTKAKDGEDICLKTYENCTFKPNTGDCIVVNNEIGRVSDVVINYDTNEIYVYMYGFISYF